MADNFRVDEFKTYAEVIAGGSAKDGIIFVMNTSKLENILNTYRILVALYPFTIAAALLIGGFLCCLMILQSTKEAAIMRMLGTTKRKTRAILILEQLFLCITGLAIGTISLLINKGLQMTAVIAQMYLFGAIYFTVILISATICSVAATRPNVLELLQTKD